MIWIVRLLRCVMLAGGLPATVGAAQSEPQQLHVIVTKPLTPVVRALAEGFAERHPERAVRVETLDFVQAVRRLAAANDRGQVVLLAVDYPLSSVQWRAVRQAGTNEAIAYPFAVGAVVFVVHKSNLLISLSMSKIRGIYNRKITRWVQLGVTDMAGEDQNRKDEIVCHVPPEHFAYRTIVHNAALGRQGFTPAMIEYDSYEDVAYAVSKMPQGIGIVGYGSEGENRAVPVRPVDAETAVLPTATSIRSHEYPLAHYAYFCFPRVPGDPYEEFLRFALSPDGQRIVDAAGAGFVSLPFTASAASEGGAGAGHP